MLCNKIIMWRKQRRLPSHGLVIWLVLLSVNVNQARRWGHRLKVMPIKSKQYRAWRKGERKTAKEKKGESTPITKRGDHPVDLWFLPREFLYFESFFHCTSRGKWYKTTLKPQIMIKGVAEKEASWSVDRFPLKPKQDSTTDKATAAENPEEIRQHGLRFRN